MRINLCALQEKRLIDRLCSLRVKGEVIEKRRMESFGSQPEKKIVVVKFRDRIIETNLDDSEFERTEIGEQIWFSPSVPERDPCNCHMFVWLIVAIAAGTMAIWAITSHSHGRTAAFLSFAAAGWIVVIAWARICSHEQNKRFRDLVAEIDFFDPEGEREQGDRD